MTEQRQKIGNFVMLRWLTFAGPVTNSGDKSIGMKLLTLEIH